MPPRRVLFLINTLGVGGWERDVAAICAHVDQSRYLPEVWTLRAGGAHESAVRNAGIHVRNLDRGRAYNPRFAWRTARQIAAAEFALVHAFLPAIAFYAALARRWYGRPKHLVFSEGSTRLGRPWKAPVQRWMLRQCTAFVANSGPSRDFLSDYGVPASQVRLIPNGHDLARFRGEFDRVAFRAAAGVAADQKLALFVGRLIPSKRVGDLVDAIRLIEASRYNLRVAIIGDGPDRQAIEAQIRDAGLQGVVNLLGARDDVPNWLRAADLFVFPSESEGLSNAVIEAALAAVPIVGCDIGGVRDVVAGDREALLVEPRHPRQLAAAIERLLVDAPLAARLGEAAQQRASCTYGIDGVLNQIYEFYDAILGTSKQ